MESGFFPLASGSKGNAIFIKSQKSALLIDAGISVKRIASSLEKLGHSLKDIEGVLITHEHHDHISSIKALNQKWKIPVFCNVETAKGIQNSLDFFPKCKIFSTGESFSYKDFTIDPFSISHDTLDPVALKIEVESLCIGVCTDLGFVSSLVKRKLMGSDILYVEANHDPSMVQASKRPYVYKKRVLGAQGHLSNEACGSLLLEVFHEGIKKVYLAHLSSECNTEKKALEHVESMLEKEGKSLPVHIAYQDQMSDPCWFSSIREKTIHAI